MPKPRPLGAAADREAQPIPIVAAIRDGVSYEAIGRRETISRERVLEIVVETMRRNDDLARNLRFLQAARLDLVLKLVLKNVAAGKLETIKRLIKVMDRLDKYPARPRTGPRAPDIRQRRLRRVERTARKPKFPEIQATPGVNPRRPPRNPLKAQKMALG